MKMVLYSVVSIAALLCGSPASAVADCSGGRCSVVSKVREHRSSREGCRGQRVRDAVKRVVRIGRCH